MQVGLQEVTGRVTEKGAILPVLFVAGGGHKCRGPALRDLASFTPRHWRPAGGLRRRGEQVGVEREYRS